MTFQRYYRGPLGLNVHREDVDLGERWTISVLAPEGRIVASRIINRIELVAADHPKRVRRRTRGLLFDLIRIKIDRPRRRWSVRHQSAPRPIGFRPYVPWILDRVSHLLSSRDRLLDRARTAKMTEDDQWTLARLDLEITTEVERRSRPRYVFVPPPKSFSHDPPN